LIYGYIAYGAACDTAGEEIVAGSFDGVSRIPRPSRQDPAQGADQAGGVEACAWQAIATKEFEARKVMNAQPVIARSVSDEAIQSLVFWIASLRSQ
jgi:hypothetical protein